ncbi:MAG: MerR family transcriptional regulator, partial [Patescibacteria group bacterium]|nr:MerR family transcriptional regulator [Patescibacteria group bacterium]
MNVPQETSGVLAGRRVVFVGKLASMARRDAAQLLRQHGAIVVDQPDPSVHLAVVGEDELPAFDEAELDVWFDAPTRAAIDSGSMEVLSETMLWQRLGLVDREHDIQRLYTPAMLADLLGIPVAVVRRWHRRGLIHPVREVRRLPYFDFQEVATARRLAELLAAGASPAAVERKLAELSRYQPQVERPLAQLSVIVEGR